MRLCCNPYLWVKPPVCPDFGFLLSFYTTNWGLHLNFWCLKTIARKVISLAYNIMFLDNSYGSEVNMSTHFFCFPLNCPSNKILCSHTARLHGQAVTYYPSRSSAKKENLCRFKVYPEVETRNSIPKPIFCPSQVCFLLVLICLLDKHANNTLIFLISIWLLMEEKLFLTSLVFPAHQHALTIHVGLISPE